MCSMKVELFTAMFYLRRMKLSAFLSLVGNVLKSSIPKAYWKLKKKVLKYFARSLSFVIVISPNWETSIHRLLGPGNDCQMHASIRMFATLIIVAT